MVIIDGKIAVSVCGLGENNAYSYALVVRPNTILTRGHTAILHAMGTQKENALQKHL